MDLPRNTSRNTSRNTYSTRLVLPVILLLLMVACGGDSSATTASAETPTSSITTTVGEGTTTVTGEVEDTSGTGDFDKTMTHGHTAGLSFVLLPIQATTDRLNEEGWEIENVEFQDQSLLMEAAVSGTVDIVSPNALEPLRAIDQGGNVTLLMQYGPDEMVMIAREGMSCDDLDGRPFGVHSEASTGAVLALHWLDTTCGAHPQVVVIAGGENRVVGMMEGAIDGSHVQLADWINLDNQRPGEFHILMSYAEELPGGAPVIAANKTWLETNRPTAVAFLAELLQENRKANADGTAVREVAERYQSDADVEAFDEVRQAYLEVLGGFPEDGGLDDVDAMLQLFSDLDLIDPSLTAEDVVDRSVLEDALESIGASS